MSGTLLERGTPPGELEQVEDASDILVGTGTSC